MFTIWREFEIEIIVNSKVKSRSISYLLEPLQLPIPPEIVVVRDSGQIAGNLEPHAALTLMVRTSTFAKGLFCLVFKESCRTSSGECHSAVFFEKVSVSSVLFGGTFWLSNKKIETSSTHVQGKLAYLFRPTFMHAQIEGLLKVHRRLNFSEGMRFSRVWILQNMVRHFVTHKQVKANKRNPI